MIRVEPQAAAGTSPTTACCLRRPCAAKTIRRCLDRSDFPETLCQGGQSKSRIGAGRPEATGNSLCATDCGLG